MNRASYLTVSAFLALVSVGKLGATGQVTLTFDTVPSGGLVTAGMTQCNGPFTISANIGDTITISVDQTVPITPGVRYAFVSWSDSGAASHTITVPNVDTAYTATYKTQYLLSTDTSPLGTAVVSVLPTSQDGYYDANTQVTLSATASPGYAFHNWAGDLTGVQQPALTISPLTVTMDNPRTITAAQWMYVTVSALPAGRQFLVDGTALTASQTYLWQPGSSHAFIAPSPQTVDADSRYAYTSWSDSGSQTHSVVATPGTASYTVTYTLQHQLTTRTHPADSATFTLSPVSIDGYYDSNSTVQATVVPNTGYKFVSWDGSAGGTANPLTFTMNTAKQIIATMATACAFSLSRPSTSVGASGDLGRVGLSTGTGCPWTATSNVPWVTLMSGSASGDAPATIRYQIAANSTNTARTGKLTIAGLDFPVYQSSGACALTFDPQTQVAPASNASYTAQAISAPGCTWSPVSASSWVTLPSSGQTFQAPSPLSYSVGTNPSASEPRLASIEAAGQTLPILQQAQNRRQFYGDVPLSSSFADYITLASLRGIMSGCENGNFCPDTALTRAAMAEAIVRALVGDDFPYSQAPYFTDVNALHPQFRFIQKMKDLGITSGCTATTYCPAAGTTRGEMAVFITRARLSLTASDTPPFTPTPYFNDVPASNSFFPYVQKIREAGITSGCTATDYCPASPITKGQMAVFLVRGILFK